MEKHLSANDKMACWLAQFDSALQSRNIGKAVELFLPNGFWRDLIAFTWNIKTMEGRDAIAEMLEVTLDTIKPSKWVTKGEAKQVNEYIEGWVSFETEFCRCDGYLRLNKCQQAWTLLTSSYELKGHEEKQGKTRPDGVRYGTCPGRISWLEACQQQQSKLGYSQQPYCLIIGGGQGGLALGARLKQLNVPTLIIDKNERPGDSWRNRYPSLCLHDAVWKNHLPYIPFPAHWPVFSPKDKLADWLEMYTKVMELNYWGSSLCKQAFYDDEYQHWHVSVVRNNEQIVLQPKHLVLATGMYGFAYTPKVPGISSFKGIVHHSSGYPGATRLQGKNAVVIGSGTSAHDICVDFWEHGIDVTMVQRSSTTIVKSKTLMEFGHGGLYSEEAIAKGISTYQADLIRASLPYGLYPKYQIPLYERIKKKDHDLYRKLEQVGFLFDFGEDNSGQSCKYLRRGTGYYIDVGASELIAKGDIKLKTGQIDQILPTGLLLSSGEEIAADIIVFATGYSSMSQSIATLISQEVADRVGKVWGLGSDTSGDPGPWEGELRNMWKPTQQKGLWIHGGNLHQSRHYSLYLALQLKARMEGIPTPVYGPQPSYHKS